MGRGRSYASRLVAPEHRTDVRLLSVLDDLVPPPAPAPSPRLYVLVGLPAAGKSHVARELHRTCGAWMVSSDRIRALLGMHPGDHTAHGIAHAVARYLLADGQAVCLDANASTERVRRQCATLAGECGAPVTVIHVDADDATRRERMERRRRGEGREGEVDVPDEIIARMEASLQVPRDAISVSGTGDLADLHAALA